MKSFGECVYEWMVNFKKNSVKAASYDRLESSFILMKRYRIFATPVDMIDSDCIQDYVNSLVRDGYALTTIKKQFHLVSSYMTYANVKGIIMRPYHKGVKLPSRTAVKKERKEVAAYGALEQEKLKSVLLTLEKSSYGAAILMMETGMRVGEVLALSWDDVNFRRRSVRICKTFVRLGNHRKSFIQNEAKSYSSNRVIPLSQKAMDVLEELRNRNQNDSDFVICDDGGEPLCYEAMRWQISRACEKAGVPYYGQHVFRHTFATNCYYKGCDVKKLSRLLGHADVNITYNVYIHLFGDDLEDMRSVLD